MREAERYVEKREGREREREGGGGKCTERRETSETSEGE